MKTALFYLLALVLLVFLFWEIIRNFEVILEAEWELSFINILFIVLSFFSVYLINITSWHLVTKGLGLTTPFKRNVKIWMFSNLSRFLPGGIWQYPTRVFMLSKEGGVGGGIAATALIVETLMNLSIGSVVVFMTLAFWDLPSQFERYNIFLVGLILLFLAVCFLSNKSVLQKVLILLAKAMGKQAAQKDVELSIRWILPLAIVFAGKFIFFGFALFFLAKPILALDPQMLPVFIGIAAFSWLLGYIAVFAPGGLGVTELSLASLLSVYMPFSLAAVVALAFRVFLLIFEALFLGLAFIFLRSNNID